MSGGATPAAGSAPAAPAGYRPEQAAPPAPPAGGEQFPPIESLDMAAAPAQPSEAMMRLAERAAGSAEAGVSSEGFEASVHKIKEQVLPRLLERVDPEAAATLTKDELSEEFRPIILEVLAELKLTLNRREQFALEKVLVDELLGFGPLEELLNDPDVSDIMVNGPDCRPTLKRRASCRSRRSSSAMKSTCSRSPSASSTRSAAASTRPRRWPTPA
jgi:pilus assembly protein CpaF